MSTNPNPTTGGSETAPDDRQRTELAQLRERIGRKQDLIINDDRELYDAITEWLHKSAGVPDGSVGSAVNSRLRELKRDNKMRDHYKVDDATDAFPDDCEGCPHYGVACPMVKRHSVKKTRERYIRNAASDEQLVNQLTDLAIEWDCDVVLDVLEGYQQSYGEFLQEGYELHSQAVELLMVDSETDNGVTTTFESGPSPEDRQRMQETIDAVMGDDEDGDES